MLKLNLPIAAMLGLFGSIAMAQEANPRPPQELRCIYDMASPEVRERVGEAFWSGSDLANPPGQLLIPAARECSQRHGWGINQLSHASRYAMGSAAVVYTHARMAAMGLSIATWDEIYETSAVEDRSRLGQPPSIRDRAIAAITPQHRARDPQIIAHSAGYFAMRAMVERAERAWAGLPVAE